MHSWGTPSSLHWPRPAATGWALGIRTSLNSRSNSSIQESSPILQAREKTEEVMRCAQGPQPGPLTPAPRHLPSSVLALGPALALPQPRASLASLHGVFLRGYDQPREGSGSATSLFALCPRGPTGQAGPQGAHRAAQATQAMDSKARSDPDPPLTGSLPCPGWTISCLLWACAPQLWHRD